jgi:two-component system, NarL family, sensor kinase
MVILRYCLVVFRRKTIFDWNLFHSMDLRLSRYIIFKVIAIATVNTVFSQNPPDSLLQKLNTATNDSIRVRAILDIGESIESRSTENSLVYYRQALEISERIQNKRLILSSLVNLGIGNMESNHLDTAVAYFNLAMAVAASLRDTNRIAVVYSNLGNAYRYKKDRIRALENYQHAADLLEKKNDSLRLPAVYQNISIFLSENNDYRESIVYSNKAYRMAFAQGDDYTACNALISMSDAWSSLRDTDKQYDMLQKALVLAKRTGDLEELGSIYNNLGAYFSAKKEYPKALQQFKLSYGYAAQMGNHFHLCEASTRMAEIYKKLNQPGSALIYAKKAEDLAHEIGSRSDLREIYLTRAEIEKSLGHANEGYTFLSKALYLGDSLYTTAASEKIAEMEARYESEKKQQQIAALEKDRQIQSLSLKQKANFIWLMAGLALALSIVSFLIYLNLRRSRMVAAQNEKIQQQRIVELEKDHELVVVNSLLKGQEDERGRMARDLHDGLGGLLSGVKLSMNRMKDNLIMTNENMAVFERSLDLIDTSIAELRRIAHNMMPEGLVSYGLDEALKQYCSSINTNGMLRVTYQSVGLSDRMPDAVEITAYRIIQELLNNILKHAAATEAMVQVIRGEGRLNIVVEDNGRGFDKNSLEGKKGAGWVNIRARVEYLKGQLELNSEPGKGTQVNIEFNL